MRTKHRRRDYDTTVLEMSGLVGYWMLDESSGTARDARGPNPGTYTGSPTLHVPGGISGTYGVGLNGTSQYVTIPDHATLDLGNSVSFVGWMKRSSTAQNDQIITKGTNSFQFTATSDPALLLVQEGVAVIMQSPNIAADTASWHQVGFVKVGADVRLYLDAVNISGALTNQTLANTADAMEIGRRVSTGSQNFHGSLSRAALFNRALRADEFKTLYELRAG